MENFKEGGKLQGLHDHIIDRLDNPKYTGQLGAEIEAGHQKSLEKLHIIEEALVFQAAIKADTGEHVDLCDLMQWLTAFPGAQLS